MTQNCQRRFGNALLSGYTSSFNTLAVSAGYNDHTYAPEPETNFGTSRDNNSNNINLNNIPIIKTNFYKEIYTNDGIFKLYTNNKIFKLGANLAKSHDFC